MRRSGLDLLKLSSSHLDPDRTSISAPKRDTLRSRWVSNRTGESRNDGAKKCPEVGRWRDHMRRRRKPCQSSLFRGRDASLLVVSRPNGPNWPRTETACDASGALQPLRGVAPMVNAAAAPEEQHFILSNLSPSLAQKRLALGVVLVLLVAFFITAGPLARVQLARIDAFIPAYATAMFVNDSITAALLFAQFSILRSRALLVIASGYLFAAFILIPWLLTFPGVFTPGGLLGAGPQSTYWLYILWHAGFPMFVIAYALLKDADPAKRLWQGSAGAAILSSVAMTAAVVCVATFLIIAGDPLLPRLMLDTIRLSAWYYA